MIAPPATTPRRHPGWANCARREKICFRTEFALSARVFTRPTFPVFVDFSAGLSTDPVDSTEGLREYGWLAATAKEVSEP
jgi:hypothetical protein